MARIGAAVLLLLAAASSCQRDRELIDDNDVLYRQAQQMIAERKFLEATRLLGDIGLVMPVTDELAPRVKLALADAYFFQPGTVNVVEAQSRYEQFLAFYPLDPSATYARLQVGACLLRQAESPSNDQEYSIRAAEHFERMIAELGEDDPWRRAASEMLVRAQERLAEHEWIVASFYLGQQRWNGAARRLQRLVDRYPGASRREEAFYELARARLASGDFEQARATIDILLREYPSGSMVEAARRLRDRIDDGPRGTVATPSSGGEIAAGES
jgi:outer membrane protein assembly factor BamD